MGKQAYTKKDHLSAKLRRSGAFKKESTEHSSKKTDDIDDTVFIRNLAFETEEEALKEFIEKNFGPTVYCLICKDKDKDESKGTAFAKFKDHKDASKCLQGFKDRDLQYKFHLAGRNLIVLPVIRRDRMHEVNHKTEKSKDKRNLALSREGFIHHLSDEAKEMSKADLEKRKVLDLRKKDLLKNLHNFVSSTRLCIHNLPISVDDNKLRKIFIENIDDNFCDAKIVECRVMRNKKGSGKLGTSKGFGFVAFSKHDHALAALRSLNNNPDIFTKDKRPIVEFSIENMVALNKKKTRLVNSQRKNQALQKLPTTGESTALSKKKIKLKKTSSKIKKVK